MHGVVVSTSVYTYWYPMVEYPIAQKIVLLSCLLSKISRGVVSRGFTFAWLSAPRDFDDEASSVICDIGSL